MASQLHEKQVQAMKELRENEWSLEGIARIFGITVAAVRFLIHEEDPDNPCPLHPDRGWGHE